MTGVEITALPGLKMCTELLFWRPGIVPIAKGLTAIPWHMNRGRVQSIVSVTGVPTAVWINAAAPTAEATPTTTAAHVPNAAITILPTITQSATTHPPTPHGPAATGISIAAPAEHW